MKSKVNSDEIFVDSAGTAAYHVGDLPDRRSIEVAKKYGIDITNQRARKFVKEDFDRFTFIYAMDEANYIEILRLAKDDYDKKKVKMILNESSPNGNLNVPDPYYGGDEGFENVYKMLDEACEFITQKL